MRCSVTSVLKCVVGVVLLVSVASCRWGPPGIDQLKEYCEKDAELTMGEVVYVDGYHTNTKDCAFCVGRIVEDGFDFIEFTVEQEHLARADFPELGYWRMEKVSKDSNQCNAYLQRRIEKKKKPNYKSFVKEYCIAVYPIESLRSEYGYSGIKEWEKIVNSKNGSQLKKFRTEVVHFESGTTLSRRVTYRLRPYPTSSLSYGKSYRCDKVGVLFDKSKGSSVWSWSLRSNKQGR
jgi:hypothetical protein